MADRFDYYFRQLVTEAELDGGFAALERADRDVATDMGFVGVMFGLDVTEDAGVPDLTVDVGAPGSAYDKDGQRMNVPTTQDVDMSVDENSVSTAVTTPGNERILALFLRFDRQDLDPRTDGLGNQVFFSQPESFTLRVVQGAEAPVSTAIPPPLDSTDILLADVTLIFGQTQILNADIDDTRREDQVVASQGTVSVRQGRLKDAIADLVTVLGDHISGAASRHDADQIDYDGGGNWADGGTNPATDVEAQLDKMISELAATVAPAGLARVGARAQSVGGESVSAGTADAQVLEILTALDGKPGLADTNTWTGAQTFDNTVETNDVVNLDTTVNFGQDHVGTADIDADTVRASFSSATVTSQKRTKMLQFVPVGGTGGRVRVLTAEGGVDTIIGRGIGSTYNAQWRESTTDWTRDSNSEDAWVLFIGENGIALHRHRQGLPNTWADNTGSNAWEDEVFVRIHSPLAAGDRIWRVRNDPLQFVDVSDGTNNDDGNPDHDVTVLANALYPKLVVKAWGYVSIVSGVLSVEEGVNFTATITTNLEITLLQTMANGNIAVVANDMTGNNFIWPAVNEATNGFDFFKRDADTGALISVNTGSHQVSFVVMGEQA